MTEAVRRGDVFLVSLDPTRGDEIQKTRPCVVVSPDELNSNLRTFIVAPLTTGGDPSPFRVPCRFEGQAGYVVIDKFAPLIVSAWCVGLGSYRHPRWGAFSPYCRRCSPTGRPARTSLASFHPETPSPLEGEGWGEGDADRMP
jgi:mRNA-degrading endonuclease toxin of MazEF toxin-antitoxin module